MRLEFFYKALILQGNSGTLNSAGSISSILGLIVSIAGFGFTLYALFKTKSATESARVAVDSLQKELSTIDVASIISSSVSVIAEIKRLQREGLWPVLPDRYYDLRKKINSVRFHTELDLDSYQDGLSAIAELCTRYENQIEDYISNDSTIPDSVKMNSSLAQHSDFLQMLMAKVRTANRT